MSLRLMVYDRTCRTTPLGRARLPIGLSAAWWAGGPLYGALDRLDAWVGAESWREALDWLATVRPGEPIAEIQYWGHGNRGSVSIDRDRLDARSLAAHRAPLAAIRGRLAPGACWWFRTCDTFGGEAGQDFAVRFTDRIGADAAGFTHVIGVWQSGLHRLSPGQAPHWDPAEGIALGTPARPIRSEWSAPWRPHTISCFDGAIPVGW